MNSVERAEKTVLSLPWAVYWSVHKFAGSVAAVAAAIGVNATTLQKKIKPECDSHHANLDDLENIIHVTQDVRILESVCALYGCGYFRLPDVRTGAAMFERSANLAREFGELMGDVSESLRDGKVSRSEVAKLDKSLMELVAAAKGLIEEAKRVGGAL